MINRKYLAATLNIVVVLLAFFAWRGSTGNSVNSLELASFLGVVAFSWMWVHYVVDVIAPQENNRSHDFQYYLSRAGVLIAILLHPFLVNWYLLTQGFGYPPASYEALLGSSAWAVLLGWLAIAAFILFEVRGKLSRFIPQILYVNIVAMFLVLIHGFVAGMFVVNGWYQWVWFFYLATFTAIAAFHYRTDQEGLFNRYFALTGITLLALGGFVAGAYSIAGNNSSESSMSQSKTVQLGDTAKANPVSSEKVVTPEELSARDGKGSDGCWVAVSGTVYDLTGNNEWQNGVHTPSGGQATCGQDLTSVLGGSPHGSSVLSNLPKVGKLSA